MCLRYLLEQFGHEKASDRNPSLACFSSFLLSGLPHFLLYLFPIRPCRTFLLGNEEGCFFLLSRLEVKADPSAFSCISVCCGTKKRVPSIISLVQAFSEEQLGQDLHGWEVRLSLFSGICKCRERRGSSATFGMLVHSWNSAVFQTAVFRLKRKVKVNGRNHSSLAAGIIAHWQRM